MENYRKLKKREHEIAKIYQKDEKKNFLFNFI